MYLLQVIPIAKSIHTESLSYFSVKEVALGSLVTVPLRKKEIIAIVVERESVVNMKLQLRNADYQIRNIRTLHQSQVFSPAFLATCKDLKNFYATTTGRVIEKITPSFVLKNLEEWSRTPSKDNSSHYRLRLLQRDRIERVQFYKTLHREQQLHKKSMHIICPTIAECQKLFSELQEKSEVCFLLHSGMTKRTAYKNYRALLASTQETLLISTPGFIDTPQHNKSLLILESSDSSYYENDITDPVIDMRIMAERYAFHHNLECILASSVHRPEEWSLVSDFSAELIEPFQKKIFATQEIQLVLQHKKKPRKQSDENRIKELSTKKTFSLFSKEAMRAIKTSILNKENIFVYTHRKSLAPNIVCNDCGNIACSETSGLPYSLYIKKSSAGTQQRIFVCNQSGESIPAFDQCQFCRGWNLHTLGIGTEGVLQELRKHFKTTPIHIIDSNHNTTKKSLREIRNELEEGTSACIIVGTQKARAHLYAIDQVIITSLSSFFSQLSYQTNPRIISLIKTLSESSTKPLLLQSRNISDDLLPILSHGIYSSYIEHEIAERKQFHYPPNYSLIVIETTLKKAQLKKYFSFMKNALLEYDPHILTQPAKKTGFVKLVSLVHLEKKEWNCDYQDPKLRDILMSFDRSTRIRINPKNINS